MKISTSTEKLYPLFRDQGNRIVNVAVEAFRHLSAMQQTPENFKALISNSSSDDLNKKYHDAWGIGTSMFFLLHTVWHYASVALCGGLPRGPSRKAEPRAEHPCLTVAAWMFGALVADAVFLALWFRRVAQLARWQWVLWRRPGVDESTDWLLAQPDQVRTPSLADLEPAPKAGVPFPLARRAAGTLALCLRMQGLLSAPLPTVATPGACGQDRTSTCPI